MPAQTMADRIPVRNPNEISKLRKAGEVSARILMELQTIIRPGITTKEMTMPKSFSNGRSAATPSLATAATPASSASQ